MSNHVKFSEDQETFRTNLSSELIVRTEGSPVRQHRVRLSRIKDPRHKLLQVNQSVDINLIYKDLLKEKMNKNKIVGNIKSKRLRQISPGRFYHRPESKSSPIRNENDTSLSITTLKSKNNKQENSSDDKLQEKLVLNKSKNSSIVYAGIYSPETNRPSSAGDFPLIAVSSIIESGFNWLYETPKKYHFRNLSDPINLMPKKSVNLIKPRKRKDNIIVKIKKKFVKP